jgi:hypothetical protein
MGYARKLAAATALCIAGALATAVGAAERTVTDRIKHIELTQLHDYGNGEASPQYVFRVDVLTDTAVTEIAVLTANGTVLTLPNAPHTAAGDVQTWTIERPPDRRQWIYELRGDSANSLDAFGDGEYRVTAAVGRDALPTSVWFAEPGSHAPLPQPVTPPTILSPAAGRRITPPVVVSWAPLESADGTSVYVSLTAVSDRFANLIPQPIAPRSQYATGPHDLAAPGSYVASVAASAGAADVSAEGVPYRVGKSSAASREFDIEPRPAGTIALGQTAYGRIDGAREVDTFTFDAGAGDYVVVDVNADALYSVADLCLRVIHPDASVMAKDADSGDLAGGYYTCIDLRGWRLGNEPISSYDFWIGVAPYDPRTTVWFGTAGTYTIEIATEEWLRDRDDGPFGQGCHYELNVLDANTADLPPAGNTPVRLHFPDHTERSVNYSAWVVDGWRGYEYEMYYGDLDPVEAAQFCPPGDYAVIAKRQDGIDQRRDFAISPRPPLPPVVTAPAHNADDIVEPIQAHWEDADPALHYLSVKLYYENTWDEVWSINLPTGETESLIPPNRSSKGTDYELNVVGYMVEEPEPKLYVFQEMRSWLNFQTADTQFRLSGTLSYAGHQSGPILVQAALNSGFDGDIKGQTEVGAAGPYSIPALAGDTTYFIRAFVDADGNGEPGLNEAYGEYQGAGRPPAGVLVDVHVQHVDIQLVDVFDDEDNLPDWWEIAYFEDLDENDDGNPDSDPFSNIEEYRRGSNPAVQEGGEPLNLTVGWNLISLPSRVIDPTPQNLFPGRQTGPLWKWSLDHYAPVPSDAMLSPKQGYWLYVPAGDEGTVMLLIDTTRTASSGAAAP